MVSFLGGIFTTMNHINLESLAGDIEVLVKDTGKFILNEREKFSSGKVEFKGGKNNLVSFVDRSSEEQLTKGCAALIADSGFIREEGGELNPEARFRWIIDPLDGTTNFIHDVPSYCISLALQEHKKTVLGVVYDIPRGDYYQAILGQGAWVNGNPIAVSPSGSMGESLFSTGFPYEKSDILADYLAVIAEVLRQSRGIRRFGAAALDLAWVASGKVEGFFEMGLQAWDVAAGELLVREAGGVVTDFSGTDNFVFGKQIVAGAPLIHAEFLEIISALA